MAAPGIQSAPGFSLVEALVATTIMAVGATALVQLFVIALGANERAREITRATVLAQEKMEELLADAPFEPSPADVLQRNTSGYHDRVGVFVRRWSADRLPADPEAYVVQVRVIHARRAYADSAVSSRSGDVHLVSVARRRGT